MKREDIIVTTVTHDRKGDSLCIKNITGDIGIVTQASRHADTIIVDITADDTAHDKIVVQVAKGKVSIVSRSPVSANLKVQIPAGTSVRLEGISGTISINETVEVLTIVTDHACKIFAQTLHGMMLRIGQGASINVQRLLGHCDIVADGNAMVEVRDALISTLSAKLADTVAVSLYGSARFADVALKGWASLHINRVDEIISKKAERFSTLDLGWSNRQIKKKLSAADKKQYNELINQARTEIVNFVKEFLDVVPSPTIKEA